MRGKRTGDCHKRVRRHRESANERLLRIEQRLE